MGCAGCEGGEEHLCAGGGCCDGCWCLYNILHPGMTMTYNDDTKHGHLATDSGWTYGGYSGSYTVHHRYRGAHGQGESQAGEPLQVPGEDS